MKNKNSDKWIGLRDDKNYLLKDLGRPAIFLLPLNKLTKKINGNLHGFILENFGAYTTTAVPSFGFWRAERKKIVYDKCREYEVSFIGKEKIPLLLKKLAEIAALIDEECIYFKAGQYTCLIFPTKK